MSRYSVADEQAGRGFSAYVPDLPGCVTTGRTRIEVARRIRDAIVLHVAGLREACEIPPKPRAWTGAVDV